MERINENAPQDAATAEAAPSARKRRNGASPVRSRGRLDSGAEHSLSPISEGPDGTVVNEQAAAMLFFGTLMAVVAQLERTGYYFKGRHEELLNWPALILLTVCGVLLLPIPHGRGCLNSACWALKASMHYAVRKLCGK